MSAPENNQGMEVPPMKKLLALLLAVRVVIHEQPQWLKRLFEARVAAKKDA